ncbi:methionine biosynthesis protein MetW [Porticoccaceae bacterium]|jgi:methionine biosynthesis protein MetW|nr:methionine biosynthesis protein MetW [Porticoccaceae bacterium]MBT7946529.1 methionine biosynthesis protein MetW [Porticoccaceae bacterium]MDC3200534.1 methionine biosynthesis protein MetW [Porticoccaceae bacterium]
MINNNGFIGDWIKENSRVLDLGCGDGSLLEILSNKNQVRGYGLEIDPDSISQCIGRGVNVIEQDLNEGLENFADASFDTVVMMQTLQALRYPHLVLDEMLRIGKQCIVTFPNFGHWRTRADLVFSGRMPVTKRLSYQWYDTPNIHFFTYKDFEALCVERNINIVNRNFVGGRASDLGLDSIWPNLFAHTAVYRLSK